MAAEQMRRSYRKSVDEEEGRDIYSLCLEGRMGIWCAAWTEIYLKRWLSWFDLILEQQIDYSETGGYVLTQFFDMCQGRWCCEEKVADLKETKTCTGSGPADGAVTDEPEEYSMKMLIRIVWRSADEELPMSQEGNKKSEFCEDSDDSVVDF